MSWVFKHSYLANNFSRNFLHYFVPLYPFLWKFAVILTQQLFTNKNLWTDILNNYSKVRLQKKFCFISTLTLQNRCHFHPQICYSNLVNYFFHICTWTTPGDPLKHGKTSLKPTNMIPLAHLHLIKKFKSFSISFFRKTDNH